MPTAAIGGSQDPIDLNSIGNPLFSDCSFAPSFSQIDMKYLYACLLVLIFVIVPTTTYSQNFKQELPESRLYISETALSFSFLPDGKVQVEARKALKLDLSMRHQVLLDAELVDSLEFRREKDIKSETAKLVDDAKAFGRKFSRLSDAASKKKLLAEWNKKLLEFDGKINRKLGIRDREKLDNAAVAANFFAQGMVQFVNQRTDKEKVTLADFAELTKTIKKQMRSVEQEVWQRLLESVDDVKRVEFELVLEQSLSGREPTLSVLWRSLAAIEAEKKPDANVVEKQPIFVAKSGRLVPIRYRPKSSTTDLVTTMALVAQGHPDQKLIQDTTQQMFMKHLAIQSEFNAKKSALRRQGLSDGPEIKELLRQMASKQSEARKKLFDLLPENARKSIRYAVLASDYQRHGIQAAWFAEKNQQLMEFPPDRDDLKVLRENAKDARELLEKRVHEILKEACLPYLLQHFESNSPEVKWIEQQFPLQIPAVELIGLDRSIVEAKDRTQRKRNEQE